MLLDTRYVSYVFVYDACFTNDDDCNYTLFVFLIFRELSLPLQVTPLVLFVIALETSCLLETPLCVIKWENVLTLTRSMFCEVMKLIK